MRNLEGRNIGAVVDGERVTVVSGESEKSRVVPLGNVSRRRVKIPIDIVRSEGGREQKSWDRRETLPQGRGEEHLPEGWGKGRMLEEAEDLQEDP